MREFENYHSHSHYSNLLAQADSVATYDDYAKVYQERGMHCLFTTEHGNRGNVFEAASISERLSPDYQLTPIASAEAYFVPDRLEKDKANAHLILVAKDQEAFYQMNEIFSESYQTGYYYKNRIDFELLCRLDPKRFIVTTACVAGPVMRFGRDSERIVRQLKEIFRENFFLEVQPHLDQKQIELNTEVLRLYRSGGYQLMFATDSHYINREDAVLRDELLKASNIEYPDESNFELFLPTADEAYDLLVKQGVLSRSQISEAMENTLRFRDFDGVKFTKEKKIPNIHPDLTPEQRKDLYRSYVYGRYEELYGDTPVEQKRRELADITENEVSPVCDTDTEDYFLLLKRLKEKAMEHGGILTHSGRGSAVSFATNHLLGLTSINRLRCPVELYPARFISRERMEAGLMPDYDANIANLPAWEQAGKDLLGEYGCLPMVAYGSNQTLSAFKMLARARDIPFDVANEVSDQLKRYELAKKHADDPDDIRLSDYVSSDHLAIVEESSRYKNLYVSAAAHPCAHIMLDRDVRREFGVIRLKSVAAKDPTFCAYVDGANADQFGLTA